MLPHLCRAQEIFRGALQTEEIRLKLCRPVPERSDSASSMQEPGAGQAGELSPRGHSLFKSVPPPPPQRSPHTALTNHSSTSSLPRSASGQLSPNQPVTLGDPQSTEVPSQGLMQSSSRKLGKRIHIELTKGLLCYVVVLAITFHNSSCT